MTNDWMTALREFNYKHPEKRWTVPMRQTRNYAEVRRLLENNKPEVRRGKAIAKLRQEEEATRARNVKRAEEGKAAVEARRVAAEKEARLLEYKIGLEKRRKEAEERTKKEEEAQAALSKRLKEKAEARRPAGSTKETEELIKGVQEIPEDVSKIVKEYTGDSSKPTLAGVFMTTRARNRREIVNSTNALVDALYMIATGQNKAFIEGRADVYPSRNVHFGEYDESTTDLDRIHEDLITLTGGDEEVEEPMPEQVRMLNDLFSVPVHVGIYRRRGVMTHKSGLVIKTQIDKKDKATAAKEAEGFLERLAAKWSEFLPYIIKHNPQNIAKAATKREAAKAAGGYVFSKKEATATPVTADKLYDVYLTFFGNEAKATEAATRMREKHPGKRFKYWIPRGKNLYHSILD